MNNKTVIELVDAAKELLYELEFGRIVFGTNQFVRLRNAIAEVESLNSARERVAASGAPALNELRQKFKDTSENKVKWHSKDTPLEFITECSDGTKFINNAIMPAHAVRWHLSEIFKSDSHTTEMILVPISILSAAINEDAGWIEYRQGSYCREITTCTGCGVTEDGWCEPQHASGCTLVAKWNALDELRILVAKALESKQSDDKTIYE